MKRTLAILLACLYALTLDAGARAQTVTWISAAGTTRATWQVDEPNNGPLLNDNAGAMEVRNAGNSAFAVVRGATPAAANDLTTKAYVDAQVAGGSVTVVNGVSMPPGGSIVVGQVLQSSGPSSSIYAAVNLALAASVTGTLPTIRGGTGLSSIGGADTILGVNHAGSSLTYFTPSGDVALASGAFTVSGLQGHALPSPAPGFLQWTGSAWALSATPQPNVTASGFWHETAGVLDSAASRGSPAQVAITNGAGTDAGWVSISLDGSLSAAGALTVGGLKGSTLPALTAGNLNWTGSAWALTPAASVGVTGSGLWHSTAGALDGSAFRGSPGQFPVTNAAGTDTPFVSLSGDATLAPSGAATLATVNGAPGTFGSGANVPVVTVNGKGLVTGVTTTPVTASLASATGVLPVANGGTGLSAAGSNGQILTTVSGAPAWATTSAPGTTLVFQPGGTSSANVFTTWPALFTASAGVVGAMDILFDGTFSSGALTIPSGTYAFTQPYVRFVGPVQYFGLGAVTVTAASGAVLSGVRTIQNMTLTTVGSTAAFTVPNNGSIEIIGAHLTASPAGPLIANAPGSTFNEILLEEFSQLGTSGGPNVVVHSTSSAFFIAITRSSIELNSFDGTGTEIFVDNSNNGIRTTGIPLSYANNQAINLGYNDALVSPALGVVQTQAAIDALKPRAFTAGLDLSGTATSQTVVGLRGNSLPAPSSGWLQWTGSALTWSNPPGGVTAPAGSGLWHSSSGILDSTASRGSPGQFYLTGTGATDDGWFSLSGDATASTSTPGQVTITRVNGATVPAAGALTTGNAAYVSGASALTYGPLQLNGGAGWVTGSLPSVNQAPQTLAGDVTGVANSNVVSRLTGTASTVTVASGTTIAATASAPAAINLSGSTTGLVSAGPSGFLGPIYSFPETTSPPAIFVNTRTSDAATHPFEIFGQSAFGSSTGTNRNGGSIVLLAGSPNTGGVPGAINFVAGDTNTSLKLSEPSIGGVASLSFNQLTNSPIITQDTAVASSNGQSMTMAAQNGGSGTTNGGALFLQSGSASGSGSAGAIILVTGDTNTQMALAPNAATVTTGNNTTSVQNFVGVTPSGTKNSQFAVHKTLWQGGQIVSNGGQIDLLVSVPNAVTATVHARGQCRIVTAGTTTAVGDSIVQEGVLAWKNVGGTVTPLGGITALQNPIFQADATMQGTTAPMHMSPSGQNVDVTMLIGATAGSLGTADCTIWADVDNN